MNKAEFSEKLRTLLEPLDIEDLEIASIPDVGNVLRFRINQPNGWVKYGSFKFNQLDEELLAGVISTVKEKYNG